MGVYLMYQVLVNKHNGTVLQFVKGGSDDQFEVHEDFMWVQYLEEIDKGLGEADYEFNRATNELQKIVREPTAYDLARKQEYPDFAEQLDMLYHDMDAGSIPGKETSKWFEKVKEVKENNPKP